MKRTVKSARGETAAIAAHILLATFILGGSVARAGIVSASYTDLPLTTLTNLTSAGVVDWVKWGNNDTGQTFSTVRKAAVPPIISSTLTLQGTGPSGTTVDFNAISGQNILDFGWTDGDSPVSGSSDTIVTETILPAQSDYPLGLGMFMQAAADATTQVLDVWVQGFNADMLVLATMSGGGSDQVTISPSKVFNGNNFSSGVFRVTFSGAGETLTVTTVTLPPEQHGAVGFPNAAIFAAAIIVPEPASGALMAVGAIAFGLLALRRRRVR